ncbi:hypothetical protein JZ785_09075 [Alicyclobacillus curvatus]|jgi:hypothetical protein|nr:hypothetical protein JZ785_09075 [Alicyclobacillus curvatus]
MRRQVNVYLITMVILGGLLATSLVLKMDSSQIAHAATPAVTAPHQQSQNYVWTHHERLVKTRDSVNKLG